MLHTPMSMHDIFPSAEEEFNNRQCVTYNGRQLYVEKMNDGRVQILQLLSSDPHDFMNSDYMPGTILN